MRTPLLAAALVVSAGFAAATYATPPNPPPFRDCCCEEACVKVLAVKGWIVAVDTCDGLQAKRWKLKEIPVAERPE